MDESGKGKGIMYMEWIKEGMICDRNTLELDWFKLNIMCPVPYLYNEVTLRIFVAFCDSQNRGRIGYIDVDPTNPSCIKNYSRKPVLDLGDVGTFDENGTIPTSLIIVDNVLYMYYCGFQKQVNVPYTSLLGIACSRDNGDSFKRISATPLLERQNSELFIRTGADVIKDQNIYKIFYASGNSWISIEEKLVPVYNIREIESKEFGKFENQSEVCLQLKNDEYGMTIPQVMRCGNQYQMIFSVRSKSKGYRLGYAESINGLCWKRDDQKMGIDVSKTGWDSEMICFGKMFKFKEQVYLFYCGNHYGVGGLGWARLK